MAEKIKGKVVARRKDKTGIKIGRKWYTLAKGVPCPEYKATIEAEIEEREQGNPVIVSWRVIEEPKANSNGTRSEAVTIEVRSPTVELWAARYDDKSKKLLEFTLKGYTVDEVHKKARELKEKLGIDLESMHILVSQEVSKTGLDEVEAKVLDAIKKIVEEKEIAKYVEIIKYTGLDDDTVSDALDRLIELGEIVEAKIGAFKPA
jgi:hypothetical protein